MSTMQQVRYTLMKLAWQDDNNLTPTKLTKTQGALNLIGSSPHVTHMDEKPYRWVTDLAGGSNQSSLLQRKLLQPSNIVMHGSPYSALMRDRPSSRTGSAIPNQTEMYYVHKSNCLVSLIMVTTSESVIQHASPWARHVDRKKGDWFYFYFCEGKGDWVDYFIRHDLIREVLAMSSQNTNRDMVDRHGKHQ
jgi:hypothetical protein